MISKAFHPLSAEQREQIRQYLLGKPASLSKGLSAADFPREYEVSVFVVDPREEPVKTYTNQIITNGKFFRIVQLSHKVLGALYFDHDRYGILGTRKTVDSFRLADLSLTKTQYEELLADLSQIVHSIDPNVQIEWDGMEFMDAGPVVTQ